MPPPGKPPDGIASRLAGVSEQFEYIISLKTTGDDGSKPGMRSVSVENPVARQPFTYN
ncbi:YhjK domain protein [Klebsiella oxytoca]|nr:YhjK domain protein [Klebsiella oxytoca]EUC84248.1 hypothetical protein HMPREF1570_4956 [Klebsiella oxytoca KA-2]